ncbi:MAG: AraC family transcriptional regulator [Bacteriovoracaceae bacterium]
MILSHSHFDLYGKSIFEQITLTPPFTVANHMPNEACFLYLEEGAYTINAPEEHVSMHAKDAVLMRCGSYFTEFVKTAASETCQVMIVHLYPEVLKKIFENELSNVVSSLQESSKRSTVNKYVNDELFKIYIDSLKIYFDNPSLVNDNLITLKIKELIILLTKTENARSIAQLIAGLFSQKEHSFRDIIEAHLYTGHSIEKLALLTHQSISSFKREFFRVFHDSPARYFRHKRLERAAALLSATDERIGDIAFQCGFRDVSHFSRCFHNQYGVPPFRFKLNQKIKTMS